MSDQKYKLKWTAEIEVTEGDLRDFCTGRSIWNQPGWDDFSKKASQLWEDITYQNKNEIVINDIVSRDEEERFYLDRNGDWHITHIDADGHLYARKFK